MGCASNKLKSSTKKYSVKFKLSKLCLGITASLVSSQLFAESKCMQDQSVYDVACYQQIDSQRHNSDNKDVFVDADWLLNKEVPTVIKEVPQTLVDSKPSTNNTLLTNNQINNQTNNKKIKLTTENLEVLKAFYQGTSLDYDIYLVANDDEDTTDENSKLDASDVSPKAINLQLLQDFYSNSNSYTSETADKEANTIANEVENKDSDESNNIDDPKSDSFFNLNVLKGFYRNFDFFGSKKKR